MISVQLDKTVILSDYYIYMLDMVISYTPSISFCFPHVCECMFYKDIFDIRIETNQIRPHITMFSLVHGSEKGGWFMIKVPFN